MMPGIYEVFFKSLVLILSMSFHDIVLTECDWCFYVVSFICYLIVTEYLFFKESLQSLHRPSRPSHPPLQRRWGILRQ